MPTFVGTDVLIILGNHGLVLGGADCKAVEHLLSEVQRCLTVRPRQAQPADYAALADVADCLSWEVPNDDEMHALGTDAISRTVLSGGLLYPCQAIFSNSSTPAALFRSVPYIGRGDRLESWHCTRPFIIFEGRGVILNRTTTPAERAMISGLAQVVQPSVHPRRFATLPTLRPPNFPA